jgi:hypothetical protein
MISSLRQAPARLVFAVVMITSLGACHVSTTVAPVPLSTTLSFASVLARPPMRDSAHVEAEQGRLAVAGLLNQTAPCFSLSSAATEQEERVVLRLTATETQQTCNTFAAGAFDYDVAVQGLTPGTYDVDVLHRVLFKDGRVTEEKVGTARVQVR